MGLKQWRVFRNNIAKICWHGNMRPDAMTNYFVEEGFHIFYTEHKWAFINLLRNVDVHRPTQMRHLPITMSIVFMLEINWQNRGNVIRVSRVNCIPLGPISVIVTTRSSKPLYRFYGGTNNVRFNSGVRGGRKGWMFSYRKTLLKLHRLCQMFLTIVTKNSVIFRDDNVQTHRS